MKETLKLFIFKNQEALPPFCLLLIRSAVDESDRTNELLDINSCIYTEDETV